MTSIIICSTDDKKFRAVSAMYGAQFAGLPHEIIRIPDARSIAEGYNRGIAQSQGRHLVFSHDDVEVLSADFAVTLEARLSEYDVIGVAGTSRLVKPNWAVAGPHYIFGQVAFPAADGGVRIEIYSVPGRVVGDIQAMDGMFLAARRDAAVKLAFDQTLFDGFHLYDIDFTYRAFLSGHRLAVCCDMFFFHQSAGKFDQQWKEHAARFLRKYQSRLATVSDREFAWTWCEVADKAAAIELMQSARWDR